MVIFNVQDATITVKGAVVEFLQQHKNPAFKNPQKYYQLYILNLGFVPL